MNMFNLIYNILKNHKTGCKKILIFYTPQDLLSPIINISDPSSPFYLLSAYYLKNIKFFLNIQFFTINFFDVFLFLFPFFLFLIALFWFFFSNNYTIYLIMALELLLFSVSFIFIITSWFTDNFTGLTVPFFLLAVAATESVIGLALIILMHRLKNSINLKSWSNLHGFFIFDFYRDYNIIFSSDFYYLRVVLGSFLFFFFFFTLFRIIGPKMK